MISPGNVGKTQFMIYLTLLVKLIIVFLCQIIFSTVLNVMGFFHFNENIFTEIDFFAANFTNRPTVELKLAFLMILLRLKPLLAIYHQHHLFLDLK